MNNAEYVSIEPLVDIKPFVDEILKCLIIAREHLNAESHVKADLHLSAAQRIANIVSTLRQNGGPNE